MPLYHDGVYLENTQYLRTKIKNRVTKNVGVLWDVHRQENKVYNKQKHIIKKVHKKTQISNITKKIIYQKKSRVQQST